MFNNITSKYFIRFSLHESAQDINNRIKSVLVYLCLGKRFCFVFTSIIWIRTLEFVNAQGKEELNLLFLMYNI